MGGFILSLPAANVLVALLRKTWATAPVRTVLTALVGAAPLCLHLVVATELAATWRETLVTALVGGVPAGLAAAVHSARTRRSAAR